MAKRKIHQLDHTTARGTVHTVKVYRDPEYNEYVVKQWSGDVLSDSEYFTSDKQDALETAQYIIDRIKRQFA